MLKTTTIRLAVFAAVLPLAFVACKKEKKTEPQPEPKAQVMVAHKVPDAQAVEIYADNVKLSGTALGYNSNTGYVSVPTSAKTLKLMAAGTNTVLGTFNVALSADKNYTVFACNRASSLQNVVLEDNLAAPAMGKAHVRFVHLSPDAPAVSVFSGTSTTPLFSNVTFKGSSAFVPVDATVVGSSVALTVKNAANATVLTTNVMLTAGKVYTIVARGFVTPPTGNTNTLTATLITNK